MNVNVVCSKCHESDTLESNDYPVEAEGEEAAMGAKVERWTNIDFICNCGQEIEITLHETEYPEGNFQGMSVSDFTGADSVTL